MIKTANHEEVTRMWFGSMDAVRTRIDSLEKEIQLLKQDIDLERRGAILELSPEELKMILGLPVVSKIDAIQAPREGGNCDKDIEKLRIRVLNIGPWTKDDDPLLTFHPKICPFGRGAKVEWPGCRLSP